MSVPSTHVHDPAAGSVPAQRWRRIAYADLLAVAALLIEAGLIEFHLRRLLSRPFFFDEAWRAYEITLGGAFVSHPTASQAPVALGWIGIEGTARLVLGNTEAALRAPMFVVLPMLAVVTYLLARRWLGAVVSFSVSALVLANLWIVDYGLELKSYTYEALLAVATVGLYLLTQRTTWRPAPLLGLYVALGLTCVFSLPNLFVLGPLLALDLFRTLRARQGTALRITGEAIAGVIALAHYELFVRLQSGVADLGFFQAQYAPHAPTSLLRFTLQGLQTYVPGIITGPATVTGQVGPADATLPPAARYVLAAGLVLLLAAGVVAAARDAAGRVLLTAIGGALLLELLASAVHRWPFGLLRTNIFLLPLLYVLGGLGAAWVARALTPPKQAARPLTVWRAAGIVAAVAVFAGTVAVGGQATAKEYSESSALQFQPTMFGGIKAAVVDARQMAEPGAVVIIRSDRTPPVWYLAPWLYYMGEYRGYPARVAALPRIPARNTLSVIYVTPSAVDRFLAAHHGSPAVFLLELNLPGNWFPPQTHEQSLATLKRSGYCPVSAVTYPLTGEMTVLRPGCAKP